MLIFANVLALALIAADEPKTGKAPVASPKTEVQEAWQLTLPEAIRIGLENSDVIRVLSKGPDPAPRVEPANSQRTVIARLNADASIWNFKAAVMAHVRSIEQQYWALSFLQVNLWARETAVKLAEDILRRERAELEGHASRADIAEAEQHLEQFKLDLVSATSDVITTERQLRNILGLPATDNRRIIPSTTPSEMKLDATWEDSLAAMNESHPDIAQQRQLLGIAELKGLIEGENPTLPPDRREASKLQVARQREFLQQVLLQSTKSLARFFLGLDANYKQYQAAQKLREASQKRLETQRAFYDEGRITVDRLLDAVSQYANAVSKEAECKSTYNTEIAAFEEAQGTLLIRDKITVVEGPTLRASHLRGVDQSLVPATFTMPTQPAMQATPTAPVAPSPSKAQPASTTYKLKATFGVLKGLEVELQVSPSPK